MESNDKIIEMARALGRAIQLDERYVALKAARDENDANADLQDVIGRFELAKFNLQSELQKEEGDREKILRYNSEMQEAYGVIIEFQEMQRYAGVKQDVDRLYNWITAIIATAVNGGDPDGVDEPSGECSGSCESCGGCG